MAGEFAQLIKQAESGDVTAQCDLADHFLDLGASAEAVGWIRLAAQNGDAWAQYMLGLAYHYGDGVRKSRASAERRYRKCADHGYDSAFLNLGLLHATSRSPRHAAAFKLFQKESGTEIGIPAKNSDSGTSQLPTTTLKNRCAPACSPGEK